MKDLPTAIQDRLAETFSPEYAASAKARDASAMAWLTSSVQWRRIQELTSALPGPISVLELGCGTGRYFNAYKNSILVVGVDYSAGMLDQAKAPVGGFNTAVRLVRGNIYNVEFRERSFDLIVCVGVLGASCPFDRRIVERFARFLKPTGAVLFSVMSRSRAAENHTIKSALATAARPFLLGPPKRWVTLKLGNFCVSTDQVAKITRRYFRDVDVRLWVTKYLNIETHVVARHAYGN